MLYYTILQGDHAGRSCRGRRLRRDPGEGVQPHAVDREGQQRPDAAAHDEGARAGLRFSYYYYYDYYYY